MGRRFSGALRRGGPGASEFKRAAARRADLSEAEKDFSPLGILPLIKGELTGLGWPANLWGSAVKKRFAVGPEAVYGVGLPPNRPDLGEAEEGDQGKRLGTVPGQSQQQPPILPAAQGSGDPPETLLGPWGSGKQGVRLGEALPSRGPVSGSLSRGAQFSPQQSADWLCHPRREAPPQ